MPNQAVVVVVFFSAFCFQELVRELQAVEADIAFANAGRKAGRFSSDPLPQLWPPPLPLPPPPPPPSTARMKTSPPSLLVLRRDHDSKQKEKTVKERSGNGLRGAGQRSQQRRKQRRSQPERSRSAGRVAFGERARVGLEGGGGGGGGGIRRRLSSGGRAAVLETKRTSCIAAQAECRVEHCAAAAGRRIRSNTARRTRTPTNGSASAQVHTTKRRQQIGNVLSRGGGCSGRDDSGRTRCPSTVLVSSGNTSKRIVRSGVDRTLRPAAAAAAAVSTRGISSSASVAPRSSSRLEIRQTARQTPPLAVTKQKGVLGRPAPMAEVTSAAARFGAPTAASSVKDRRQEVVMATSEARLCATPSRDDGALRGGRGRGGV